jgi:hypothetical protein
MNRDATRLLDPDGIVPVNLNVVNNNGSSPSHLAALKGNVTVGYAFSFCSVTST